MSTKFNKSIAMLLSVVMVFTMLPFAVFSASAAETTGGLEGSQNITKGSGTAEDPYIIENVAGLNELAQRVNGEYTPTAGGEPLEKNDFEDKYFKLLNDIDASTGFNTPIGKDYKHGFYGTFDGNGKTVTLNIAVTSTESSAYAGLFGYNHGAIKNLTVGGTVNGTTSASENEYAGGVCGLNDGTIANCTNKAGVTSTYSGLLERPNYAGGICGFNNWKWILNCSNQGEIKAFGNDKGQATAGGICGYGTSYVINSYNISNVEAIISSSNISYAEAGGICGYFSGTGIINCYSSGNITATNNGGSSSKIYKGGIVGELYRTANISQKTFDCYYKKESGDSSIYGVGAVKVEEQSIAEQSADVSGTNPLAEATMKDGTLKTNLNNSIDTNKLYEAKKWVDVENGYPTFETVTTVLSDGTGTKDNPYKIKSVADLNTLAHATNTMVEDYAGKYVQFDNDITDAFTAENGCIGGNGKYIDDNNSFKGTVLGNNKTVKLDIKLGKTAEPTFEGRDYVGLFGSIYGTDVIIENLSVTGNVAGNGCIGSIVGCVDTENNLTLKNCSSSCNVNSSDCKVGGIAGRVNATNDAIITDCTNTGNVTITGSKINEFGGVAGIVDVDGDAIVAGCTNTGDVTVTVTETVKESEDSECGGVVGIIEAKKNATLTNCSNEGDVTVTGAEKFYGIGGVAGDICASENDVTLTNCSSEGSVTVTGTGEFYDIGGVAGGVSAGEDKTITLTNCYHVGEVKGTKKVGGIVGCQRRTTTYNNCYHAGQLTATKTEEKAYGICGCNTDEYNNNAPFPTTANKCYYETEQGATQAFQDKKDSDYGDSVKGLTNAEMKSNLLGLLNTFVDEHNKELKDGAIALSKWTIRDGKNGGYPMFGESIAVEKVDFSLTVATPQVGQNLATTGTVTAKSTPENAVDAEISKITWTDKSGAEKTTAENNGEYTAKIGIKLSAKLGYELVKDIVVTATMNGEKANIEGDYETGYTVSYAFGKLSQKDTPASNPTVTTKATQKITVKKVKSVKLKKAIKKGVKIKAKAKGKLSFKALAKQSFKAVGKKKFKSLKKKQWKKYFKITKKGKIKFTKKTKKGTYKIKVKITAKRTKKYKKAKTTKVIKVKVK